MPASKKGSSKKGGSPLVTALVPPMALLALQQVYRDMMMEKKKPSSAPRRSRVSARSIRGGTAPEAEAVPSPSKEGGSPKADSPLDKLVQEIRTSVTGLSGSGSKPTTPVATPAPAAEELKGGAKRRTRTRRA